MKKGQGSPDFFFLLYFIPASFVNCNSNPHCFKAITNAAAMEFKEPLLPHPPAQPSFFGGQYT
jgi:hypothetical protein